MTKQAREVVAFCDFVDVKQIEMLVSRIVPSRIIKLVWAKDPRGIKDLDWFLPFFNGYVKESRVCDIVFDDNFWFAYVLFDSICDLSVYDFELISIMSKDTFRMKTAIGKTKVFNVKYIHKIFESIKVEVFDMNTFDFNIEKHEIKKHELA